MKTLCVLESVSRADGGIFEAERATWPKIAAQMKALYEDVLNAA